MRTLRSVLALVAIGGLATSCGIASPPDRLSAGSTTATSRARSTTSIPGAATTTGTTVTVSSSVAAPGPTAPSPTAPTPTAPSPTVPKPPVPKPPRVPVIVIDPGHSGRSIRSTTVHGLRDIDYPNYPEIYEMFDVSTCVAKGLRADGYRVLLTKRHVLSSVSHTARAAVANANHADLAISVHDDHGVGAHFEATYDQRGLRRSDGSYPAMYRGTGRHRTVYAHPSVARLSQRYARILARERAKTQGRPVRVTVNSYNHRAPLEPGNLALVQLLSRSPWVYNEMGALTHGSTTGAMSISSETGFARGLLAGVEAAVPLVPGRPNARTRSASRLRGCLVTMVRPKPGTLTRPHRYLPYGFG